MGKGVLIFAEHKNGQLRKAACELLSHGRGIADQLGGELAAVVMGQGLGDLAAACGQYGADKVYVADAPDLATYTTEPYTAVLTKIIGDSAPAVVLAGNTVLARDMMPRVAERVKAGLVTDCTGMVSDGGELTFTRPIYAGKAFTKVAVTSGLVMATIRPNALGVAEVAAKQPEVVQVPVEIEATAKRVVVKEVERKESKRPELTEADIIVSGGRGMKGPENFVVLEELADVLGAAVGASRAAVDAGWREHDFQVGQTGKTVSPNLYIACGISGAIQHMAGMGSSKVIVAINKDPEANIFSVADYGIVNDLFKVVPALTQEVKKLMAEA